VDPYTTGSVEGPYILEGTVLDETDDAISFQLHPGVVVDLKRDQTEAVEEATDPATGRTLIRVTLKPDAELSAVFQLRLARLAASQAGGMPFPLGAPGGPGSIDLASANIYGTPQCCTMSSIGEGRSRCCTIFIGCFYDDFRPYSICDRWENCHNIS
jgi:hypothetical protein